MNNRFNLNEEEKNRIKGLHGIVIEQDDDDDYYFGSDRRKRTAPPSDDTWPFTMERYEFENKVPGGTGLPEECDKCLMATIPEQYLDRDKRFGVFKTIVKLIIQTSGLKVKHGREKVYQVAVSTWEQPIIKLSDITSILKDFSPLGAIKIAKDLFKCATNECSPKKIHTYRVEKGFDPTNVTGYRDDLKQLDLNEPIDEEVEKVENLLFDLLENEKIEGSVFEKYFDTIFEMKKNDSIDYEVLNQIEKELKTL